MEEFVLEFHPMQTQRVQEALQHVHAQQNSERRTRPRSHADHHPAAQTNKQQTENMLEGHRRT
jgi:hypothetical protein